MFFVHLFDYADELSVIRLVESDSKTCVLVLFQRWSAQLHQKEILISNKA